MSAETKGRDHSNNRCNKVRNRINYQQVNIYGFIQSNHAHDSASDVNESKFQFVVIFRSCRHERFGFSLRSNWMKISYLKTGLDTKISSNFLSSNFKLKKIDLQLQLCLVIIKKGVDGQKNLPEIWSVRNETFNRRCLAAYGKGIKFYIPLIGCNEINFYCKFIDTAKHTERYTKQHMDKPFPLCTNPI